MTTNSQTAPTSASSRHLKVVPDNPTQLKDRSIVYLAGPMTGLPDWNRPAFNAATEVLEGSGLTVINPARVQLAETATWQDYMRYGLRGVSQADVIVVLPGWRQSRGAQAEVAAARSIGLPVFEYDALADGGDK